MNSKQYSNLYAELDRHLCTTERREMLRQLEAHAGDLARAELAATQVREERTRALVSDILGQQHVLKGALSFMAKWGDDPVFVDSEQRQAEVARVTEAIGEWHRRMVAALAEKPEGETT